MSASTNTTATTTRTASDPFELTPGRLHRRNLKSVLHQFRQQFLLVLSRGWLRSANRARARAHVSS
ncbi:hypothetical protein ColTof4_10075 [Colletotrichum tofieldiae]|nr:hypothetical protein ColTof4_10075 [Colletotrichum tofieldiae]